MDALSPKIRTKRRSYGNYRPTGGLDALSKRASRLAFDAAEFLKHAKERKEHDSLPRAGSAVGNTLLVSIRAAIRDLTKIEYDMSSKE